MIKLLFSLYFICYGCYIFYTREPDYFDGETTKGKVIFLSKNKIKVNFLVYGKSYDSYSNNYINYFKQNQIVDVIYHHSNPQKNAIYSFWTYWFNATEFILSLVFLLGSYFVAVALNNNAFEPPPNATYKERKYE